NALPQFTTTIDAVDIHFIHVRSRHPNAMPLVMTHGWPGSVLELIKTTGPLTDPTAHGGQAQDAFDLVLPSIPGYGFSGKPTAALSAKERAVFDKLIASAKMGNTAYVAMMTARPQTIGYGITDSPTGLAGWLLGHPGFAQWNYGNDLDKSPSKDDVLDDITLYWVTN